MPDSVSKIQKTWLNSDGTDPDGNAYNVGFLKCTSASDCKVTLCTGASCTGNVMTRTSTGTGADQPHQVYVVTNAECNGSALKYKAGNRNFAIYGYIETVANSMNTNDHYCLASHG